ncbi:MAG: prcA [Mucilaginibacter sp.]|nr:prcA [Mucilaginibacter sp.]
MSASNWQWSVVYPTNGIFIIQSPNSQSTYVRVKGGGQVQVTYQDQCGETSHVEGVTIYSPCTMQSIVIYPNPANNQLTIQDNATPSADGSGVIGSNTLTNTNFSAELYNGKAQIVKSGQTATGSQTIAFNTSDLTNGTYYLHISENGETIEKQVIIQH